MHKFFKEMQVKVFNQNKAVGWHDTPRTFAQEITLIHSEISEATEGLRKRLKDDKLPKYPMYIVELADTIIRCLDYLGKQKYSWEQEMSNPVAIEPSQATNLANMHMLISEAWLFRGNSMSYCHVSRCAVLAYEAAAYEGYDIEKIIEEKMEYNLHRADHQRENRKAPGGKQW